MPTLDEVHQAIGTGEVTCSYDPELVAEAKDYRHLLIRRNGKLFGTVVILTRTPSLEGITIAGYGLGFWLGVDADGPVIDRREYIAGNNQVWNGDFELLDAVGFPLLWSISQGSLWAGSADAHSGTRAMRITGDLGKDDVLVWTDPRPISPGALVRAQAQVKFPTAGVRHARLRTEYQGRFDHTDLLAGTTWTDVSDHAGDVVIGGSTLSCGPVTRKQVVPDPSFETGGFSPNWARGSGVDDWFVIDDTTLGWLPSRSGRYYGLFQATGTGGESVLLCDHAGAGGVPQFEVAKPGETWHLEGNIRQVATNHGFAQFLLALNKPNRPGEVYDLAKTEQVAASDDIAANPVAWHYSALDYQVGQADPTADDYVNALQVWVYVSGFDAGEQVGFDDITLTRTKGNTAVAVGEPVPVTPEKSYKLLVPVTAAAACTAGDVRFSVLLEGAGRPDQTVVSSTVDYQQKGRTLLDFSFTPPSGYDTATVSVVWTDVLGGPIVCNEKPTVTAEDTSTYIVDKVIGPSGASWALYTQDSVAPAGTVKVAVYVVAEAGTGEIVVDEVDWHRRESTTSIAAIVDDLCRDPDTDQYLVTPGAIHPVGVPLWDWLIVNETSRNALLALLTGGRISPAVEFRHDPDNTLHVGSAQQLFADSGLLFVDQDLLLLSRADVQFQTENRLSRVRAIGAAVQRPAPQADAVIVGAAEAAIPDAYDWFGRPVTRTRVVEDSALNFQAFADARAADELDKSSASTQSVSVEIAEWAAWGEFRVGDWVHTYKPDALLEDRLNPKTYKGRRVYPKKTRVLTRNLTMARGDGWSFSIRRPDGTEWDIPPDLVRWDDRTKATLDLGDRRVDFANDPQGPGAGLQFLKYRKNQVA